MFQESSSSTSTSSSSPPPCSFLAPSVSLWAVWRRIRGGPGFASYGLGSLEFCLTISIFSAPRIPDCDWKTRGDPPPELERGSIKVCCSAPTEGRDASRVRREFGRVRTPDLLIWSLFFSVDFFLVSLGKKLVLRAVFEGPLPVERWSTGERLNIWICFPEWWTARKEDMFSFTVGEGLLLLFFLREFPLSKIEWFLWLLAWRNFSFWRALEAVAALPLVRSVWLMSPSWCGCEWLSWLEILEEIFLFVKSVSDLCLEKSVACKAEAVAVAAVGVALTAESSSEIISSILS